MTLVSNSPHVASLLRVNISKLICDLQACFVKSIHRFTAFSLTGKTASIALGFIYALQANFILRYSPHVASLLRINISKLGCALQANFIYAIALTSLRSSGSISLNSSATFSLDSLRASSVYSFFPNGKNCIHCSRIHLRLAGSIHQEQ